MAAGVVQASAADISTSIVPPLTGPVVDNAFYFSGLYGGAYAGWAWDNTDVHVATQKDEWAIGGSSNGVSGGFQIGHDTLAVTRYGDLVLGVVGDFSLVHLKDEQTKFTESDGGDQWVCCGSVSDGPPGEFKTSVDHLATIRARIGVPTGDRTLLYAHGGLAMANFKLESVGSEGPWAEDPLKSEGWELGWVAGFGVEHALTTANHNLSLFAEYSFMGFGDNTVNSTDGGDFTGRVIRENRNLHLIKFGANYRFPG
jgi:outer membrane immunogenic protein